MAKVILKEKNVDTMIIRKRLNASKKITINLPQLNVGDEVALIVVYDSRDQNKKFEHCRFDLEEWAEEWATNLGETIQATDIESFTGRSF
jgi:hypothetical protein